MKILHAHKYYYMRAGAERYMLGLMRLQEKAGHTVAPFSMHYPKNLQSQWSEFFVPEMNTEEGGVNGFAALGQLKRAFWYGKASKRMSSMLDAFQPDILHVHNIYTHISPSILSIAKKQGIPVVMTVHDFALISANYALWDGTHPMTPEDLNIWRVAKSKYIKDSFIATLGLELVFRTQKILRLYDRYIDKYFAISDFMKEWLVRGGYDENKIEVIYNFADVDFTPVRKKDSYFLYAGRIEDYKGVGTLIKAIRKYPSTVLKIAGTGTADLQFRKMAKNMKNVEFLSFVDTNQLNDLFSKARAVVVPSIWNEPFGLVAIEAMAKGAPVIVSDSGALPEIVEDYVSGRIFSSGNAAELSKILGEFIGDEKYSRSIGEAAQKRAKEIGNQSKHLKKVIDAYSELI